MLGASARKADLGGAGRVVVGGGNIGLRQAPGWSLSRPGTLQPHFLHIAFQPHALVVSLLWLSSLTLMSACLYTFPSPCACS